jgi:amidase
VRRPTSALPAVLALALLLGALAPTAVTAEPATRAPASEDPVDCLRDLAGLDLQHVTVLDLQAALAEGRITSRQLVERYLARIAAFDAGGPQVNGIREIHPDALGQADRLDAERAAGLVRGPMHGIPVLLKDNIGTADMPTTAGSIALEGNIPDRDAFLVQRLREEGAIILGKAELAEFANWVDLRMPNGYSSLGGQVLNAYDLSRNPSGSSSGSATSGAMAFAAVVLGSETSGSILSPAEVQGLAAVKPTVGLVSRSGVIPLAPSWDTTGPMVRSITDAAAALTATAGVDPEDPRSLESRPHLPPAGDYMPFLRTDALEGVRLGVQGRSSANAVLREAYEELERQGATLVDVGSFATLGTVGTANLAGVPNEFKAYLDRYLATEANPPTGVRSLADVVLFSQQHPDRYPYGNSLLVASAAQPGVVESTIPQSVAITAASRAVIDRALAEHDVSAIVSGGTGTFRVGAAAGYPTVAVPAGAGADGRSPINLAFLGTAWTEPQLLAFAYDYEQATLRRVPPTEVNAEELVTEACADGVTATSPPSDGAATATSPTASASRRIGLDR